MKLNLNLRVSVRRYGPVLADQALTCGYRDVRNGSELARRDDKAEPLGRAAKSRIERHEPAVEQLRERDVFGVIGLRPAE
jgi:hypothetical protein